jgi:hypothetical protein
MSLIEEHGNYFDSQFRPIRLQRILFESQRRKRIDDGEFENTNSNEADMPIEDYSKVPNAFAENISVQIWEQVRREPSTSFTGGIRGKRNVSLFM